MTSLLYKASEIHKTIKFRKDRKLKPLISVLPEWLTPNQLTLFRFVIVLIWLPFVFLRPSLWQVFIFLFVFFLDLVDGGLARFKNQVTYIGKYLDTFSDRINYIVLFLLLSAITNHIFSTFKFLIIWESATALFIIVEYFLRRENISHLRSLVYNLVYSVFLIKLILEIIRFGI